MGRDGQLRVKGEGVPSTGTQIKTMMNHGRERTRKVGDSWEGERSKGDDSMNRGVV